MLGVEDLVAAVLTLAAAVFLDFAVAFLRDCVRFGLGFSRLGDGHYKLLRCLRD